MLRVCLCIPCQWFSAAETIAAFSYCGCAPSHPLKADAAVGQGEYRAPSPPLYCASPAESWAYPIFHPACSGADEACPVEVIPAPTAAAYWSCALETRAVFYSPESFRRLCGRSSFRLSCRIRSGGSLSFREGKAARVVFSFLTSISGLIPAFDIVSDSG